MIFFFILLEIFLLLWPRFVVGKKYAVANRHVGPKINSLFMKIKQSRAITSTHTTSYPVAFSNLSSVFVSVKAYPSRHQFTCMRCPIYKS